MQSCDLTRQVHLESLVHLQQFPKRRVNPNDVHEEKSPTMNNISMMNDEDTQTGSLELSKSSRRGYEVQDSIGGHHSVSRPKSLFLSNSFLSRLHHCQRIGVWVTERIAESVGIGEWESVVIGEWETMGEWESVGIGEWESIGISKGESIGVSEEERDCIGRSFSISLGGFDNRISVG